MEVTLAVDYGAARVGVAVCAGWMARPLDVLPHGELDALLQRLLRLAQQELATRFVVGLPINADGSEGAQAEAVRRFAHRLAAATPLPVLLWDEYGSSQAAQAQLLGASTRRKGRREKLDAVAAALFLQEFVDQGGVGGEQVLPDSEVSNE